MSRVIMAGGNNLAQAVWCYHQGFLKAGYEVAYIPTAQKVDGRKVVPPERMAELRAALAGGADMLFWWQAHNDASNSAADVKKLKAEFPDIPFVAHSFDDPFMMDHKTPDLSSFSHAVTCCSASKPWYADRGIMPIVGYPPCDADLHGAAEPTPEYACDISFAATNTYQKARFPQVFASRDRMIGAVLDLGTVRTYGYKNHNGCGWCDSAIPANVCETCAGYLHYLKLPALFASSRINLCSHVRPDGYGYLNERVVEVMASGGFLLCDRVAGIEHIFEEDKEIVLWSSLDELREKAVWWLAHEAERAAVAVAARVKAFALFDNKTEAVKIHARVTAGRSNR